MKNILSIINALLTEYSKVIIQQENQRHSFESIMPILEEIKSKATEYIEKCKTEININNKAQMKLMDQRAELYEKVTSNKEQLSTLDMQVLKIIAEIQTLEKEIIQHTSEIKNLQKEIQKKKEDQKYWQTVWWATCWIPFANIGTGVKFIKENDEYSIRVKQIMRKIDDNKKRIYSLNNELTKARQEQKNNKESSSALTNQVTALEGQIAFYTEQINSLKTKMAICQKILDLCCNINIKLSYAEEEISSILEDIENLRKIKDEILSVKSTDNYIIGCVCKGDKICLGQKLNQKEYLLSENRRFVAIMQSDNNFVVYNSDKPIWSSNTWGATGTGYIDIDINGLVKLNNTNKSWNIKRSGAYYLIMQNDGNLVSYTKDNRPVWASDTYTYANVPSICFKKLSN